MRIAPSFVLRAGISLLGYAETEALFAYGWMGLVGWTLDEDMDESDALFQLELYLDDAVLDRSCPHGGTRGLGVIEHLDHLRYEHGYSPLLLCHWLASREKDIVLTEGKTAEHNPLPTYHLN